MAGIVSNQIPLELRQNQGWVNWKSEQYPDEKSLEGKKNNFFYEERLICSR